MTKEIPIEQKRVNADKQAFFTEFSQLLEKYDVDFDIEYSEGCYGGGYVEGIGFNFNNVTDETGNIVRFYDSHFIRGEYHDSSNYVVDINDRI